jgi:hypothetical protein
MLPVLEPKVVQWFSEMSMITWEWDSSWRTGVAPVSRWVPSARRAGAPAATVSGEVDLARQSAPRRPQGLVGAENPVTSRDPHVFVDEAAEPVSS